MKTFRYLFFTPLFLSFFSFIEVCASGDSPNDNALTDATTCPDQRSCEWRDFRGNWVKENFATGVEYFRIDFVEPNIAGGQLLQFQANGTATPSSAQLNDPVVNGNALTFTNGGGSFTFTITAPNTAEVKGYAGNPVVNGIYHKNPDMLY